MGNRSRTEIVDSILDAANKGGETRTKIMYFAFDKKTDSFSACSKLRLYHFGSSLLCGISGIQETIHVEVLSKLHICLRFIWLKGFSVELYSL